MINFLHSLKNFFNTYNYFDTQKKIILLQIVKGISLSGLPWWLRWLKKKKSLPIKEKQFQPLGGTAPGEGNGSPLQYSRLGNHTDRGAWRAAVHGVTESDMTFTFLI